MKKKKAKYRHIEINKKKYYFYSIIWHDILGDSGHASEKEFKAMKPAQMTTNAYVFSKDKKELKTFSDRNVFPIGCIIKMEKILL